MSDFTPMPDARHEELMKAASETIDMCVMSVEPDAALRKVAVDYQMRPNEVDLVSHAVNNALAYEHIKEASSEADRIGVFPLTDAESVKSDVFGKQQTKVASAPGAPDIRGEHKKLAAASYFVEDNYAAPTIVDPMAILEAAWAVDKSAGELPKLASNPFAGLDRLEKKAQELATDIAAANDRIYHRLDQIKQAFASVAPPDFELFKTACALEGVSQEGLDLVAAVVGGEGMAKAASSDVVVDPRMLHLVDCATSIEKAAASIAELQQQLSQTQAELQEKTAAGFMQQAGAVVSELPEQTLGESFDDNVRNIAGDTPDDAGPYSPRSSLGSELQTSATRGLFNEVAADRYLSGYGTDELRDAFNAGVEAGFGDSRPKLVSYMRQYLASEGNVPLDLMLRATQKVQSP